MAVKEMVVVVNPAAGCSLALVSPSFSLFAPGEASGCWQLWRDCV